jgi:amino acid adenylation domain-containing protein
MHTVFDETNPEQLTLVDILRWRAQHSPQREAYTFLLDTTNGYLGETKQVQMTYADLDHQARCIAELLQDRVAPGERVLLLYPPSLEYVAAIFGCFYAGVVAVPAYPPRLNQSLMRIQTIIQDARASAALTTSAILSSLRRKFASETLMQDLHWIETDTIAQEVTAEAELTQVGRDLRTAWSPLPLRISTAPAFRESHVDPEALALLQYTSGSTGSPKGVMLTHKHLMQNAALIQEGMSLTSETRSLFWLPPYHDMGLMGGILQGLYTGYPTVLMTPAAFLQQPLRWLQAISSFRATVSGGPNFAYDLCVKKATEDAIKALNLSSWAVAFNGAEPVRAETLQRFAEMFADSGFRPEMFYPCYGMAETTLFVSGGRKDEKPSIRAFGGEAIENGYAIPLTGTLETTSEQESSRLLVSCGYVRQGQEITIVDPQTRTRCAPGTIGEIWVRGPNVALGYWGKAEETAETFHAFLRRDSASRLSGERLSDEGPFLRTGDLGFCVDNELFVTGRLKDLIIIRGRNLYPQDIEQVVEKSHPLLRQSCCAAFAVEGAIAEQVVVVQEVMRHYDEQGVQEAIQAICQAVLSTFDVEVSAIELLRVGTIPKTSSGKIQRRACRSGFLAGELNAVYRWQHAQKNVQDKAQPSIGPLQTFDGQALTPTRREIVDWLVMHIAKRAHIDASVVDLHAPFVEFGLNSLEAIGLSNELEQWLRRSLSPTLIYEYSSIDALARSLAGVGTGEEGRRDGISRSPIPPVPTLTAQLFREQAKVHESREVEGWEQTLPFTNPLSHNQKALWFLSCLAPESTAYNLLYAARIRQCLDVAAFQRALRLLADRYPILTSLYTLQNGEPVQQIQKNQIIPLEEINASSVSLDDLKLLLEEESNRPIDLTNGPVLRLTLYRRADDDYVLGFIVHHIVADFWSLEILVEELSLLYSYSVEKTGVAEPSGPVGSRIGAGPVPTSPDWWLRACFQNADYVRWQQSMLESQEGADHWQYWQNVLAGDLPVLHLPTDRPRPPVQTYRGASHTFSFSTDLEKRLRSTAKAEGVTLFTLMLATYQVLLHRYSHQDDILVGTLALGRTHSELELIIGYLANPVIVRAKVGAVGTRTGASPIPTAHHPTFKEFLVQTKRGVLEALEHQDFPFTLLAERLQPQRNPSTSPLFQTLFIWNRPRTHNGEDLARSRQGQRTAREGLGLGQTLSLEPFAYGQQGAPFDLTLTVFEMDDVGAQDPHLRADFRYNVDLFDASTISRMAQHFLTLLNGIVNNPDQDLREIPLLPEAELQKLLIEWNATQEAGLVGSRTGASPAPTAPDSPLQQDLCVHQLFEQQVERTPDAAALVCEDHILTYAELNRRANQLAHHLQGLGIGPEVLVGVYMERCVEMVVGLLGVLKAGGAYVPIDPTYPQKRVAFMLQDSQIAVLLTQQQFIEAWPELTVQVIRLDTEWAAIEQEREENPVSDVCAENLASVIYTSGSTGRPKGVLATHRATLNRLQWMWERFPFEADEICCQKTSLSFVDSVWEMFGPLLRGIRIVLIADSVLKDPHWLIATLTREQITRIVLVPSLLRILLNTEIDLSNQLPHLKYWTSSGEALPVDLAVLFLNRLPQKVLLNLYGSSEVAADATCYDSREGGELLSSKGLPCVPIGRPIANTQLYILDAYGYPVPIGVTGELYVGGLGVVRGYKNRPDLTAERFVPHPFVGTEQARETGQALGTVPTGLVEEGERLYRSGDLARYLPDGSIEFLGRIDQQVKIRGYRIELGEIEAALMRHPLVRAVACALVPQVDNARGEKRLAPATPLLAAYVVGSQELTPVILREALQDKLPLYMIPAFFVLLEALPLTANGKIDRRALPAPDRSLQREVAPHVTPRSSLEQLLAQIWQQSLGLDHIGIHDNFFALGGDSILSIQIVVRARQAGLQITPRQIFQHQTIAQLATVVTVPPSRQAKGRGNVELLPLAHLTPTELDHLKAAHPQMEDLYPLTPLQQGMLFHTLHERASGVYISQTVCTFRDLHHQHFVEAYQQVSTQQAILRTAFEWLGLEEPLQLVESRVDLPVTTLDWHDRTAEQQDHELALFLQEDRLRGFDLTQAPLIRLTLILLPDQATETQTLVIWSQHQILMDGWSLGLLLRDIFSCYLARLHNETPRLSPRRPYRDYLVWLLEQRRSVPTGAEEAYWRGYLAGFRSPTRLLIDRDPLEKKLAQPAENPHATELLVIAASTYARIQEAARCYQVTLNTLVLGAWALVLSHYSGEQDVVFGTVVSGRPAQLEGVESMIGLFINTLPVRVQVPAEEHIQNWLVQLQQQQAEHRQHEHSALVQVQSWSEVLRDQPAGQAHRLLFESLLIFVNASLEAGLREQGRLLNMERVTMNTQTNYPLTIHVESSDTLLLRVDYESQRFEATTIQRLLFHLRAVLEQLVSQPDLHLADISFPISVGTGQAQAGRGKPQPLRVPTAPVRVPTTLQSPQEGIHTLFEAQVEQNPDAIAIVYCESEMLTYGELNSRANRLAYNLRVRGIGPEVRVGILLERSLWLPIVLLGILKAGGAYVPLDPALPSARLTLLAQDAHITLLVTSEQQSKHLEVGDVLLIERLWQSIKDGDDRNLTTLIAENNLAYIVYTSGSTGRPKGVLSTHAGVVNYLRFVTRSYQLTSDIVVLQLPPLSFDASVRDIFATLIVGGRLVLMKEHPMGRDLRSLITNLQQQKVTALLSIVPSFLHTLLDTADSMHEICPSISLVLVSGERLSLDVVTHARRVFAADLRAINQYGPTEATMTSTYYEVDAAVGARAKNSTHYVPIGKPLTNMQAYILDQHLRPVPIGVIGEVYIAGPGLARGYLSQPDTTAEKFIPNPSVAGTRMYLTGDLARYLPDGTLEYHGRRDQQIKVRGNRVEPAEISMALEEHPAVGQAIVVGVELAPTLEPGQATAVGVGLAPTLEPVPQTTDIQLVAYIVPKQGQRPRVSDLRPFLQERLPEYMLPTHFITLETIPLTPNGKLDRHALPLPHDAVQEVEAIPPSELTPLQAQVATIWANMLHQPHVNIHDDFFELGGHSLLALQLINRIRTTFAVDLPLDSLFETPTVEQMTLLIEEMQNEALAHIKDSQLAQLLDEVMGKE